jgi:NAD(P)-dependent dehydrogenase (short-subunit alcohol dehydrogenase family)
MVKDKVVIITGASSGIGEATAKLLASKGAKIVLGARREDKLKQIVDEISRGGGQAVFQELDVTRPSDNDEIVKLAKKAFGGVDAIFLNAGIMPNSPLSALKTDDWHQTVDVNIKGVLNGVAAVLPTFIERKSGHVIATSSAFSSRRQGNDGKSRTCGNRQSLLPRPGAAQPPQGDRSRRRRIRCDVAPECSTRQRAGHVQWGRQFPQERRRRHPQGDVQGPV